MSCVTCKYTKKHKKCYSGSEIEHLFRYAHLLGARLIAFDKRHAQFDLNVNNKPQTHRGNKAPLLRSFKIAQHSAASSAVQTEPFSAVIADIGMHSS